MKIISLASGSKGNAYLIKAGEDNILIEAGLSPNNLKERLWSKGANLADIDNCIISHLHQ